MDEEIDCTHMEEYSIQVLKNIRSTDVPGIPADPQRSYTITYEPYYTKFTTCACGVVIKSLSLIHIFLLLLYASKGCLEGICLL